jgi:hypothetical protein
MKFIIHVTYVAGHIKKVTKIITQVMMKPRLLLMIGNTSPSKTGISCRYEDWYRPQICTKKKVKLCK